MCEASSFLGLSLVKIHSVCRLGEDFDESFVVVPIEAIVHPLCIIPDDGDNPFRFFVILPKRNWSIYFGQSIET